MALCNLSLQLSEIGIKLWFHFGNDILYKCVLCTKVILSSFESGKHGNPLRELDLLELRYLVVQEFYACILKYHKRKL